MSEPPPDYRLDHVCLAVRQLSSARQVIEKLGYAPRTEPVENTRQQVIVQFMAKPGSIDIKLIQPSSPRSPLVDFLSSRGGGLHHLAFRTASVPDSLADLQQKGAKVLTPPEPGEAFDNHLIAFAFVGAGLNVELVDTDTRRSEVGRAVE